MHDPLHLRVELADLEERHRAGELDPAALARLAELQVTLAAEPAVTADEEPGWVLDPDSGYYWHPAIRRWYEPTTGTYWDEEGRPVDPARDAAALPDEGATGEVPGAAPAAPGPIDFLDEGGAPDDPVELASAIDFVPAGPVASEAPGAEDLPAEAPGDGLELAGTADFLELAAAAQAAHVAELAGAPEAAEPPPGEALPAGDPSGLPDEAPAPVFEAPAVELAPAVDAAPAFPASQASVDEPDPEFAPLLAGPACGVDEPAGGVLPELLLVGTVAPEDRIPAIAPAAPDPLVDESHEFDPALAAPPSPPAAEAEAEAPSAPSAWDAAPAPARAPTIDEDLPEPGPAPDDAIAEDPAGAASAAFAPGDERAPAPAIATADDPAGSPLDVGFAPDAAVLELDLAVPPAPADGPAEMPAEPEPATADAAEPPFLDEAEVDLVAEPEPGAPPPLPRAAALALPPPVDDFEAFAPAPLDPPAGDFAGAGSAWAEVLAPPPEPEPAPRPVARIAPVRPAPEPPARPAAEPPAWLVAPGREPEFRTEPRSIADDLFAGPPPGKTWIADERQVVIHTREGQALRGVLREVDLESSVLPLETRGGTARLPTDRVRCVFFIVPVGAPIPEPRGRKIRVVFEDGRPVPGLVEDYRPEDPGFFLMPLDTRGRTERIYVYRSALRSIAFE